jgi:hypothetical protein
MVHMVSFKVQTGWQATDGLPRTTTPAERAEVARRLVASWNACVGLTTEQIDLLADHCDDLKAQRDQAQAQRDQLLKAAQAAVECCMVPKSSAREGGAMAYARQAQVADMIRDAIAACQPAPTVVNLPADDTEGGAL